MTPDWGSILLQTGFGGLLLFVLWKVGKWISSWISNAQQFQNDMVLRAEQQQRDMSTAWLAMLGEIEKTNQEFADQLRRLIDQNRATTQQQTDAMGKLCDRLISHEANSGQRDEVMISQLQRVVDVLGSD